MLDKDSLGLCYIGTWTLRVTTSGLTRLQAGFPDSRVKDDSICKDADAGSCVDERKELEGVQVQPKLLRSHGLGFRV